MPHTLTKPALAEIDAAIVARHESSKTIFENFQKELLPDQLKVGMYCLRAHLLFTVNPGKGGRPKKPSTADGISKPGFEGWLAERHPWLSKGTAYRWMTAFKGLGLSESATEEEIDEALAQNRRIGPVTLKSLEAAAIDAIGPPPEPPATFQQSEFDFLKDGLTAFRQQAEILLGLRARLTNHPDMCRVATARVYDLLHQLTGTHWKPSDEPDALASVNPDTIELS